MLPASSSIGVALVARRAGQLRALAEDLGPRAHALPTDLSRPDECAALPTRIAALGAEVDILVTTRAWRTSPRRRRRPRRRADAGGTRRRGGGRPVQPLRSRHGRARPRRGAQLASVGAFGPVPGQATYGAAKAFVLSYTHALREELRGTGVSAATLCPGPVRTGFGEQAGIPDDEAEKMLPKFLWEQPDTVAKAGLDGLAAGRAVTVPGTPNRVAAALNHLTPRRLLLPVLGRAHPGMRRS